METENEKKNNLSTKPVGAQSDGAEPLSVEADGKNSMPPIEPERKVDEHAIPSPQVESKPQADQTETSEDRTEAQKDLKQGPSFEDLFEDSIKQPEEGEIITGVIVRVGKENVMVDIGYKSEGQIDISEFTNDQGEVEVKAGDKIDVLIERREDENGVIRLSKEKADKVKVWDELEKANQTGEPVEGEITAKVKGGMTVDIGVKAFLPGSQVDLRPTRNLDPFVGIKDKFKILKFNRKRGNIVVSRRLIMEEERGEKRDETLKILEEGRILTGVVKNLVDYGAFIDLGGIDGLLHITDMSWGRIKHPSDILKVGQDIKVVVLRFNHETERVSLGLKQITPDPWDAIEDKYPVGTKVTGKVVSITDYGAFVELEPGIEGLIHVSEMSWTRRVRHPSKILQPGQELEIMVLDINVSNKRISLGLKQVEPNPWDMVLEKFPPGTVIKGKVRNITDFGVFIGVSEGIDGLVHISDMSWTKRIKHPKELFKKNQELEAVVLNIDKENERFSLGIKQLTSDPWEDIRNRLRPGDSARGKVVNLTDFGVFLELEEGVEGLIHISELSSEKSKNPADIFKPGDELNVEILNIDPFERKIRLSLKALEEKEEQEEIHKYSSARGNGTVKIGDLLGESLQAAKEVAGQNKNSIKPPHDEQPPEEKSAEPPKEKEETPKTEEQKADAEESAAEIKDEAGEGVDASQADDEAANKVEDNETAGDEAGKTTPGDSPEQEETKQRDDQADTKADGGEKETS